MIPPDLQQALQRVQNGTDTPADLEAVRAALQANLITLAPAARAVTVGGNSEGTVIVTGDGNTVQVLHGAAAEKLRQIEIDDLTERYLRAVADDWQYLTITTRGDDRRLPLEGVFFMLQARPRPQPRPTDPPLPDIESTEQRLADAGDLDPRDMLRTADQENDRRSGAPKTAEPPPPVPLDTVMQTDEHLAILGEPGAGKSTALQFIGLCYARVAAGQAVHHLTVNRPAIPILLRLQVSASTIVRSTLRTALRAEIQSRLQCQDEDANRLFDAWRQSPGLLVLLDGLDEVPADLRQSVREQIERSARSGIGRVILTSRPAGFLALGGLQEYTLKPFADARQEALPYLKGWLQALKPEWQAQVEEKAQSLIEQMQASAALRRLLNNPLLLRLSAQHYAATGAIARSRADLYRQWVEEAWQRARQRGASAQDKQHYLAALQTLAWHMHTGGDTSATALQTALRSAGLAADDHAAADLLHRLREQTGLLARLSEAHTDRYLFLFSHMTLREYLVAMRLHNAWQQDARRTWRFLKLRLHLPAWREPLALLAGLLDAADAQRLLTWIAHARSPEERRLRRDLLLAAKLAVESGHGQIIIVEDILRSVSVMHIKINDCHPCDSQMVDSVARSNGNVVEQAKPHGFGSGRVMTGWTNQRKPIPRRPADDCVNDCQGRASSHKRRIPTRRCSVCVVIDPRSRACRRPAHQFNHLFGVNSAQLRLSRRTRRNFEQRRTQTTGVQGSSNRMQTRRLLNVPWLVVGGVARVDGNGCSHGSAL